MRLLLVLTLAVTTTASAQLGQAPPSVMPDGSAIHIQLGDSFQEGVVAGGVVRVDFNAPAETLVDFNVRGTPSLGGGSQEPGALMLTLLDRFGDEVELGGALREKRLKARINDFEIPESGHYTLVIETVGAAGVMGMSNGLYPSTVVFGSLAGTVTNSCTGGGIAGAEVSAGPYLIFTDGSGAYAEDVPWGLYAVSISATYFEPMDDDCIVLPELVTTIDAALTPTVPVVIDTSVTGTPMPGETVMATANVIVLDGSLIEDYGWKQIGGSPVMITGEDTSTPMIDLGTMDEYKAFLIETISEPPIGAEDLPEGVPPPEGEFPGGLQDRFQVIGLNPFSLEEAGLVTLELRVTTSDGVYMEEVEVHTTLPWKPAAGIRNVPLLRTVLLHGKMQASYDWGMTVPNLSGAVLEDPTGQNPQFTPDIPGLYTVTVTDLATAMPVVLEIYAGNWRGVIVGQDMDGRPEPDPACTSCHENLLIGDQFAPWKQTGHAEIFTDLLDTSTHYGTSCFPCHTVGYDPDVSNQGFDDASDYQAFLSSGLINNPGDNWTTMLALYPNAAKRANIQCENCHGPQNGFAGQQSEAHREGAPRTTLSSDMCATCHGEPLRHARFQQWQLSAHANYELAIDEGESGSCSRCHTGNGFLEWLPILLGDEPGDPTADIEVTWTPDETHPQTCQTCHDPHSIGTTSGDDPNATVRISGNTPPLIAGFTAYGVGKGAICLTCHNSRRGLHNDSNFDDIYQTSEATRAPHGSSQADMMMGENAYFVMVGARANHSFLDDSCVKCHMEETPPPDILSYNQGGTSHTFYAERSICSNCHTGFTADGIQGGVEDTLHILEGVIEEKLLDLIADVIDQGNVVDLDGDYIIADAADVAEILFTESRGRQAMTVTLTSMESYGPYAMNAVDVRDAGTMDVVGTIYDFADPALPKAGWNYWLVENDGSFGVHNPTWAYNVLAASIGALDSLTPVSWPAWVEADLRTPLAPQPVKETPKRPLDAMPKAKAMKK